MKKTEYFINPGHNAHDLENAIKTVIEKKNTFLLKNKTSIAKIDNEDIKITYFNSNMSNVSIVLMLTYYPIES